MGNLEGKTKMSPAQFGLLLVVVCFGGQLVLAPQQLIADTGHAVLFCILVGGTIYFFAAYLMMLLARQFPTETIVEYMPRVWGKWLGNFVVFMFFVIFAGVFAEVLSGFSRAITFYMFDRTPREIVSLAMLIVCVYCALQDFGTIVRVAQIMFFGTTSVVCLIFLITLLNFRFENLLPFRMSDGQGLIKGVVDQWGMFSGYEMLLLALPAVYRGEQSLTKSLAGGFAFLTVLFLAAIVLIVGVLTVEGAKNSSYPTVMMVRGIELPGTFVERLENYLLLAWVPIVFDTLAIILYMISFLLARAMNYADHRPIVLLVGPLLYLVSLPLDVAGRFMEFDQAVTAMGLCFSFGVIPLSLLLAWWRKKGAAHEWKDC